MPHQRPYCAHRRNRSFKATPLAIAFLGLLTCLTPPQSLLAAEDPYASITPVNVDNYGNWTPLTLTGDLTTDAEDYYIGARAGGSSYYDILKINKNGTTRVTGNRIHVFSRPMDVSTDYNNVVNFWLHTNEDREQGTNTVFWDAELIVDSEGAVNHSNYYPITQGIATDNYATDYYPGHTAHTNVDFLKPVSIRVNNNSSLTDNAQSNSVIALGIKDSYNKASHLTFHETVNSRSTSALARPVSGIVMESQYADTGDGMPTLHFQKDATFTAQSTGGGDALGAKFFATGWTDTELNTSNSALDGFNEEDIAVLRNTVHQQKLITNAGSTLTLNAMVKAASRRTRGSAIGLSTFAYPRSEQIFELAGKTVVSATSELYQTTKGLNHRIQEGAFKANYSGGLDVTSITSIGESYGVDAGLLGGRFATQAQQTKIRAEGSSKTWGLLMQAAKPEAAEDTATAVQINAEFKGDTTITATSSGFYARAIDLNLQNTTSNITFDQLNATSTGSSNTQQYTFGIKVSAFHKVKSTMSIDGLTLKSSGSGVLQSVGDDSQAEMTIRNATVVEVPSYAFIASTGSGATDTSHIRLEGSLTLPADSLFASGVGTGAWIETDLTQTSLSGDVNMEDGARFTLGLSAPTATANLHLTNALTPEHPATIEVNLKNGGRWSAIGEPSHVNTITFASRGVLDLRQVTLPEPEPETAPTTDTETTMARSAPMLRAAAVTPDTTTPGSTAGDTATPTTTPIPASLVTNELLGTDGWITLNVNTQTNEGQVLEIVERSEGNHTLDIQNQSDQQPTGMPILLVRSVNGLTNPEAYTATFKEAQPVEVGELKYYVGNSTMVNEEATSSAHPERAVEDDNTDNWYLYTANRPEPEPEPTPEPSLPAFTDTAKGAISASTANYLLALQTAETLRERLGDIHTFASRDERVTPWAKVSGTNWRIAPQITASHWDLDLRHVKVGADTPVGDVSRVGGYFGYTDFSSQRPAPADIKGRAMEGGLYWTTLSENRVYTDLVARVGRVESQFDTTDTRGAAVKARDLHNHYFGLSLNVGRQLPVTEHIVFEPMAYVGYTRFADFESRSDHGLHAQTKGYNSLLTMLGTTAEWRMVSNKGNPWTLYAKGFWEKEWLAKNAITFNDFNTYDVGLKASRFVYGLGAEGTLGKASTWHVDVERSTGNALREDWQVNAGVRIPF